MVAGSVLVSPGPIPFPIPTPLPPPLPTLLPLGVEEAGVPARV